MISEQKQFLFNSVDKVYQSVGSRLYIFLSTLQALGIGVNPLYLMIPTAVATSYAFMLPVATPPNAMVYVLGYFSMAEMVLFIHQSNLKT